MLDDVPLNVTNTLIKNNVAAGVGGGIYVSQTSLILSASTVNGNQAVNPSQNVGGLNVAGALSVVKVKSDTTITGNGNDANSNELGKCCPECKILPGYNKNVRILQSSSSCTCSICPHQTIVAMLNNLFETCDLAGYDTIGSEAECDLVGKTFGYTTGNHVNVGYPPGCVASDGAVNFQPASSQGPCNNQGSRTCVCKKDCPPGGYQDEESAILCKSCPSGYFQPLSKRRSCFRCPAGQYQEERGQSSCQNCSAGMYTPAATVAAAIGLSSCTVCEEGRYVEEAGWAAAACKQCAVGTYMVTSVVPRATSHNSVDDCVVCSAGTFSNETGRVGRSSCDACPSGYFLADDATNATQHDNKDDCLLCAVGYFSEAGSTGCTLPPINCAWAPVTATDCTPSCGIVTSQKKTITEANGGTCTTAAPTYACQPGDGSCPLPINCAWAPVTATDCTSSCGIITSQTKTIIEANGGTCTTAAPTYDCQPGDGSCPLPINCAWAPVTATDCTSSCGIITSQTKTITEANGGTCTTAAPTYDCQPGDGSCPQATTEAVLEQLDSIEDIKYRITGNGSTDVSSASKNAKEVAELLNVIDSKNVSTQQREELTKLRENIIDSLLSVVRNTTSERGGSLAAQNETQATIAIVSVSEIVRVPSQNSGETQSKASTFLETELKALADLSTTPSSVSSQETSKPLPPAILDAVALATSSLMESMHREESSTTLQQKSDIGAKLASGASSLSIIQLRGAVAGDPPVVRSQGVLTIQSKRHDVANLMVNGDVFEAKGGSRFDLPPLFGQKGMDGMTEDVDTSVVAWSLSPWSYEAGEVDSFVVGLTLTTPGNGNKEVKVSGLDETSLVRIVIARTSGNASAAAVANSSLDDSCVYLDTQTSPRAWSTQGCHVDKDRSNASHVTCSCNHLTDFAIEFIDSVGSAERVFDQFSEDSSTSFEAKVSTNMAVILLVFGFLLFALLMCLVSTWHYKKSRSRAKRLVHELARHANMQIEQRKKGQRRLSFQPEKRRKMYSSLQSIHNLNPRTEEELGTSTSLEYVIESLRREFWTDEHLHTLKESHKTNSVKDVSTRFFHGEDSLVLMAPDEAIQIERIRVCSDCWSRFFERVFIEHEWVAPLRVTVEERHFTPAARIMLLTIVIMGQMFVEALLYDLRFPNRGGTCSGAASYTYATTTNATNHTFTNGTMQWRNTTNVTMELSFPLPKDEGNARKLVSSLASCMLTLPIALIVFNLLYKIGMAKKSERLWKRLGTSNLSENLHVVRKFVVESTFNEEIVDSFAINHSTELCKRTVKVGMNACGSTAYIFTVDVDDQGRVLPGHVTKKFTLTSRTKILFAQTPSSHQSVRLNCPKQGTFVLPCSNVKEAAEWVELLKSMAFPMSGKDYNTAARGVTSAAIGTLDHINVFISTYSDYQGDKDKGIFNPIRNKTDHATLERLRTMVQEFCINAKVQQSILHTSKGRKGRKGRKQHKGHNFEHDTVGCNAVGHLFGLKNKEFLDSVRSRLLPHQLFLREHSEDIVAKRLTSCCCKFFYSFGITSNRLDITMAHQHQKQRYLMLGLGLCNLFFGVYVILFGFCHGPEVTLDWMYRLSLQLVLSALAVRPMSILALSAILPTLVVASGQALHFKHLEKMASSEMSEDDDCVVAKEVEMVYARSGETKELVEEDSDEGREVYCTIRL